MKRPLCAAPYMLMKSRGMYLTALSILFTTLSGCDNDENQAVINPQKAILGRWELVENTFGPVSYPGSYEEYSLDSALIIRNSDGEIFYDEYWFADSLLYKRHVYIDEVSGDTILVDTQRYKYDFLTQNKLMLDWQVFAMDPISIYKRIN